MTDRIAELRALRQAERSAFGGNDLMPWASAADVLRGALHDNCDALLDCAEALQKLTFVARTSGGTAGRDEDLVAACEQAEAALTALNGDDHAG